MKFFVNESNYDDVGQVLTRMGQGFEYEPAERYTSVSPQDAVLFLNCGGKVNSSATELASFIEKGGTIYASDMQATFVAQIFPAIFESSTKLWSGVYNASVLDQALQGSIGSDIDLDFDMPFWGYLTPKPEADKKTRVYLNHRTVKGKDVPLVVSYDHPQGGSLFFTAFHNSAQKTKKEEELLRFLLFRPIMSRNLQEIRQDISETISIQREYTGGLRKSSPEKTYSLDASANWKAILSWTGQGKIALDFLGKDGTVLKHEEQWSGPLEIMADVESGGSIRVRCTEFGQSEIPFCLVVGTGDGSAAPSKKPEADSKSGELVLEGSDGKKMPIRIKTTLGKSVLSKFGGDSQFCSEPQFTLETKGKDWVVEHHPKAKNETLLNGKAVSSPTTLKNGDQLAVGREPKGIIKLPLKVRIN